MSKRISVRNILPSLDADDSDVNLNVSMSSVELSEKESILKECHDTRFKNVEELYAFLGNVLASRKPSFRERLHENIQNYLVFGRFFEKIEIARRGKKNRFIKGFINKVFSWGSAVRNPRKADTLDEALVLYKSRSEEWKNKVYDTSGNILRGISEKYYGIEPVSLLRIIRRTYIGKNPFDKSQKMNHNKEQDERPVDKLRTIAYMLIRHLHHLKAEDNNAVKTYVWYLLKYGFGQHSEWLNERNYFDTVFYEALALFVVRERKKKFTNEETFVRFCCERFMVYTKDMIRLMDTVVTPGSLTVQELQEIKDSYFPDADEKRIKVGKLTKKKVEVERDSERTEIVRRIYRKYIAEEIHNTDLYPEDEDNFQITTVGIKETETGDESEKKEKKEENPIIEVKESNEKTTIIISQEDGIVPIVINSQEVTKNVLKDTEKTDQEEDSEKKTPISQQLTKSKIEVFEMEYAELSDDEETTTSDMYDETTTSPMDFRTPGRIPDAISDSMVMFKSPDESMMVHKYTGNGNDPVNIEEEISASMVVQPFVLDETVEKTETGKEDEVKYPDTSQMMDEINNDSPVLVNTIVITDSMVSPPPPKMKTVNIEASEMFDDIISEQPEKVIDLEVPLDKDKMEFDKNPALPNEDLKEELSEIDVEYKDLRESSEVLDLEPLNSTFFESEKKEEDKDK